MGKKITQSTNPYEIQQKTFAPEAEVIRQANAGLTFVPIGKIDTAKNVGKSTPVMVFNSSNTVKYIALGDASVAAPVGPETGIPLLGGEKFVINSGNYTHIISSDNTVYAFTGPNSQ